MKIVFFIMKPLQQHTSLYRYFLPPMHVEAENIGNRQTDKTSTVTLTEHAHRGLMILIKFQP